MGRKRQLRMTVRVVPPGALEPGRRNPHARATAAERREAMLRAVVRGLIGAARKPVGRPAAPPHSEAVTPARPAPSPAGAPAPTISPGRSHGATAPRGGSHA
jgi:hypothetical protein